MNSNEIEYGGIEKRRYLRLRGVSVSYSISEKVSAGEPSFVQNISPGGISIFSHQKLLPDTPLTLRIALPNSRELIHIKGKVAWCSELPCVNLESGKFHDMGIEFLDLSMDNLLLIKSYLSEVKKSRD